MISMIGSLAAGVSVAKPASGLCGVMASRYRADLRSWRVMAFPGHAGRSPPLSSWRSSLASARGNSPVTEGSRKAILAAFFANLGIAIAKFVGFLITSSAGLLAEAVHSLADTGNQALLLLGGKRAERKRRRRAPVRLRARALLLGVRRRPRAVLDGRPVRPLRGHREAAPPARGRATSASPSASSSFAIVPRVVLAAHRVPRGRATRKDAGHVVVAVHPHRSKQPELPVVLLEDIGAEIGLFFALAGVLLAHYTDEPRWDAVGSIAIGVLLVVIAIVLAVEMKGLLDRRVGVGRGRRADHQRRSTGRRDVRSSST